MGIVYKATNTVSGKIYIGKTIRTLEFRIQEHYSSAKRKAYNSSFLYALQKYAKENFTWEVLFESDDESSLFNKEIELIQYYNSRNSDVGYNLTNGGEGCSGRVLSKETKAKIKSAHEGKLKPERRAANNVNYKTGNLEKVKEIKRMIYTTNIPYAEIARIMNVNACYVSSIKLGNIYSYLDSKLYIGLEIPKRTYKLRDKPSQEQCKKYSNPGEKHPMVKLTNEKVRAIRRLYSWCKDYKKIAYWFDVSPDCIRDIIRNKSWKHLDKEYA